MSNKGFDLSNMRQSLNRVLEDTLNFASGGAAGLPVDVVDAGDKVIILTVPLLGIVPEKLDISMSDEHLTIVGETAPDSSFPEESYLRRERRYGRFSRKIAIAVPVDADKAKAELKHNVLKITLPKIPEAQPQVINVVSEEQAN